jgi:pentatricopeptide repeat protein
MYGKDKQINKAEEYYKEMMGKGIKPIVVTFNTLIDMFGKDKQFNKAEEYYQEILETRAKANLIKEAALKIDKSKFPSGEEFEVETE